jgi:hypothetical protein
MQNVTINTNCRHQSIRSLFDLPGGLDRRGVVHPVLLWTALICAGAREDQAMANVRAPDVRAAPLTEGTFSYVNWGAIVAGAVAAAALVLVLHSFAAAVWP